MNFNEITCGISVYKEEIKEWSELKHLGIIFLGTILTFFMGFYFSIYTYSVISAYRFFTTNFLRIFYMVVKSIGKVGCIGL